MTAASTAVDRVLAQRARRQGSAPWLAALAAAAGLHVLATALFLFLPRVFHQPAPPMEFVPVTILPAAALGVPNPRRAAPPPPEPEPAAEEAPAEPEPAPPDEELPALPAPEPEEPPKRPAREAPAQEPETAPPARRPPGEPGREEGSERGTGESGERRGSPGGSRSGTTAFGSEIVGVDPDFTYGYYLDRLLSLIEAQWQRPSVGDGVEAMIAFTIERDGRVSELEVAKSSGMNAFDLAALRAVQNAAPFPRLPASYRKQALGVNLIVR
ncbi:MAG TPA: TonB family protein [Thermoanaerobaculia bacterium]|nr:TonB family protein [Thermoanaerobaculia bacterium]